MVMYKRVYQKPCVELCEEIVVERGFEVSNLEDIYGEYPEQEW
jgi:hypothetical protein